MNTLRMALLTAAAASLVFGQAAKDWPSIYGDPGATRFSKLKQITPANVSKLQEAWVFDTGDRSGGARGWEETPIVVNNLMYFSTPSGKAVALNATTGEKAWEYSLKDAPAGNGAKYGVSYWPGDGKAAPRIVVATSDGLLVQLDAKTGALYKNVGDNGIINLKTGIIEKFGGGYTPGSTPAIYKNLAIFSPTTGEQGRYGIPGDPRAFDLNTGKEVWRFHTVPQPGEPNFGSWGPDGWQDRRGPGSWVPITVDTENGLVFVALGNATDQNYGGGRPGDDLYACSLVALDANTGKLKWWYQMTHHDIGDWDVNAPPTLAEVTKDGKRVPVIAQSTKVGLLFILNRLTGEPVYGAEERPVPQTDAPGEITSKTQPFPLKPAPIARMSMARNEVPKLNKSAYDSCLAQYDKAVQAGPYTSYMMQPALVFPSSEGGGSWSGATYDPDLNMIFVNTRELGTMAVLNGPGNGAQPTYAKQKIPFDDPEGYPCSPTPWGELMAISGATGDIVWRVPLGEYKELTARGIPKTGTPNAGGPITTAGGVLFIGATSDKMFRAFDPKTGKELWSFELPNNSVDTPITYEGSDGRQYVAAIVSSGLSNFNHPQVQAENNLIVTFALPK